MTFSIEMLPAGPGDCLWLTYGTPNDLHYVLIDGGIEQSYDGLQARLEREFSARPPGERHVELFVVTHVDTDHIGGALKLLIRNPLGITFGDVWFNAWRHLPEQPDGLGRTPVAAPAAPTLPDLLGPVDGEQFSAVLTARGMPWNKAFNGAAVAAPLNGNLPTTMLPGGLKLTILSPTPLQLHRLRPEWEQVVTDRGLVAGSAEKALERLHELGKALEDVMGSDVTPTPNTMAAAPFSTDSSKPNATSIAMLAEFDGRRCLLTGDAHAGVLVQSGLRLQGERGASALELDVFKLPHHGSKANVSIDLVKQFPARRYLVSTDGRGRSKHPDGEALSRVVKHGGLSGQRELVFNARTKFNEKWDLDALKQSFGYSATYPQTGTQGIAVEL